jgi:hypothetical protein
MAFVKGVRTRNHQLLHSARLAFLDVWFTHRHPLYKMVITSTIRDISLMPVELFKILPQWNIGTNTGREGATQGLDFVGEELNKVLKGGLSSCANVEAWIKATRLVPLIGTIRDEFEQHTNLDLSHGISFGQAGGRYQPDVVAWRSVLRKNKILQIPWKNISGRSISPQPQNLFLKASKQKTLYIEKQILNFGPIVEASHSPLLTFFPQAVKNKSAVSK